MMKTRDKIIFSLLALAAFIWVIYLIKSVLTPFIFSLIIAYFLDPLVDRLTAKYKLSRLVATSLILGFFMIIFVGACAILLPIIYTQFIALLDALPGYLQIVTQDFYPKIATFLNQFGFKLQGNFSNLIEDEKINDRFIYLSQNILSSALSSSMTLINILSLIFITPILVFYFLKDWDLLTEKINDYLPRAVSLPIQEISRNIDKTLSGYVRGQFNVCLVLGLIYSSMLSFTGLNFGFLVGFLTGLFAFIPYIGILCGTTVAITFALFQWGLDINHIAAVSFVFIFGQIIESNFLTPKLIGKKIGLHPVWIIFGFFVFGALLGFIGLLVAVPLTAICGVIIKYFSLKYKKRFT